MNKRFRVIILALFCLVLAGCDTEYAKEEYYNDSKIAARGDHCTKIMSSGTEVTHGATCKIKEFDGNTTLYKCAVTKEGLINVNCSLSLDAGVAKLVYVDGYDSVTTLVECTPENPSVDSEDVQVYVNPGKCRIKLVGYDCEEVEAAFTLSTLNE